MKRPAVFFDRDNTLIVGNEYLGDPSRVVLMEGAANAVARARAMGFATVVVSNQSGVARGMFNEDAVRAVNARLEELLLEANPKAIIDRHEYCPFHPEGSVPEYCRDSDLRKPKPGMLLAATEAMALDLPHSWLIGDAPRDIEAGHAAGVKTILFTPQNVARSPAAEEPSNVRADYQVDSLTEALDYIETHVRLQSDEAARAVAAAARPTTAAPAASMSTQPVSEPLAASQQPTPAAQDLRRLEKTAAEILVELRRAEERMSPEFEFSLTKLLAGIVQIIAVAIAVLAYFTRSSNPNDHELYYAWMFAAVFLQLFTIALLVMGRQK
jgi:D-glycero-D-manno-heptose 1,7-bisphosphate phosphatase